MEIERKYLLKTVPNLENYPFSAIKQGYISRDPVIRLRQIDENYILTVKGPGQMVREEYELPLSKKQFDNLWGKVVPHAIKKNRYYISLANGLTAELDRYEGPLDGLFTVEVEFNTLEEAQTFTPPEWFGNEVTMLKEYHNSWLSLYGKPKSTEY